MKKVFKLMAIALLCTTLCMACSSDEPEPLTRIVTEHTDMNAALQEAYDLAQDGITMTLIVPNKQTDAYVLRCMALFGGRVSIALDREREDTTTGLTLILNSSSLAQRIWGKTVGTKSKPYSSKDEGDVVRWANDMLRAGYHKVVITKDERTGTYHGVAYTKKEWEKLQ